MRARVCVHKPDSCCGKMKHFLVAVPISWVFKHPPLISADPERGWQGCRKVEAKGNNAAEHWCREDEEAAHLGYYRCFVDTAFEPLYNNYRGMKTRPQLWWTTTATEAKTDVITYLLFSLSI